MRLTDTLAGRNQAVFQAVAALVQGADQAGFHVIPLFIGNGIMDIGVEGLAHFPGNVESVVLERVEEQLPGHDHAGEQAFTGFVAAAVLNGEIKAVQRGQEILEHRLAGVAHVFVMVTLDAFLEIFHLREGAQPGLVRFGLDRASGANLFAERSSSVFSGACAVSAEVLSVAPFCPFSVWGSRVSVMLAP